MVRYDPNSMEEAYAEMAARAVLNNMPDAHQRLTNIIYEAYAKNLSLKRIDELYTKIVFEKSILPAFQEQLEDSPLYTEESLRN